MADVLRIDCGGSCVEKLLNAASALYSITPFILNCTQSVYYSYYSSYREVISI